MIDKVVSANAEQKSAAAARRMLGKLAEVLISVPQIMTLSGEVGEELGEQLQRQADLYAHLLRELEHVEKCKSPGEHWTPFAKKLRRLLGDAIRLWRRRGEMSAEAYAARCDRMM